MNGLSVGRNRRYRLIQNERKGIPFTQYSEMNMMNVTNR